MQVDVLREGMVSYEKGIRMSDPHLPRCPSHQHSGISLEPEHTWPCPGGMGIHLWWGPTLPDAEPYFSGLNLPASHEMDKPITGVTIPWVPGAIYHPQTQGWEKGVTPPAAASFKSIDPL